MAALQIQMTTSQIEALASGRGSLDVVFGEGDETVSVDPTGQVDQYVKRCIGTFAQLEAHVRAGGRILLVYPDGAAREMGVDGTRDGVELPATDAGAPPAPGPQAPLGVRMARRPKPGRYRI